MDEIEYPLNRSPIVRTRDPEEMRHALLTVYGASGFALPSSQGFEAVANYLALPNVGLGFCGYGVKTIVDFPELDVARLQIPLPPRKPTSVTFEAGYQQLILRIRTEALEAALATLLGAKPRGDLIFEPTAPTSQASSRLLREMTMFLANQLNTAAAQLPAAVLTELEQTLIVAFLSAHRHNFSELLEGNAKEAAPRVVRAAEEYIEASWDRAITIEELAAQTNTSIRSLYAAFKKARGYSPMAFAKTVRMRRAHQMLLEAGPRTSVATVAYKCGFGNLGHFAGDYRKLYGELPSEVLARARRGL